MTFRKLKDSGSFLVLLVALAFSLSCSSSQESEPAAQAQEAEARARQAEARDPVWPSSTGLYWGGWGPGPREWPANPLDRDR